MKVVRAMHIRAVPRVRNIVIVTLTLILAIYVLLRLRWDYQQRLRLEIDAEMEEKNQYNEIVLREVRTRRDGTSSVAIVVVVNDASIVHDFDLALESLFCYAAHYKYPFHLIDIRDELDEFGSDCPQKDFMFRRHCIVARLLETRRIKEEWMLFIDADMTVINPEYTIEHFLPTNPTTNIVFYDRIFNFEYTAGTYLMRNNRFSHQFLHYWANYDSKVPNSWHGTDNGAIHAVMMDYYLPEPDQKKCNALWESSRGDDDLWAYEACARFLLSRVPMGGIEIRNKSDSLRWARDGWLTDSAWAPADFMLHGFQKKRKDRRVWGAWHSPIVDGTLSAGLISKTTSSSNSTTSSSSSTSASSTSTSTSPRARHLRARRKSKPFEMSTFSSIYLPLQFPMEMFSWGTLPALVDFCRGANFWRLWRYKDTFMLSEEERNRRLDVVIHSVQTDYVKTVQRVNRTLS